MIVKTAIVTPFMQNARLLLTDEGAVAVDPGGDVPFLSQLLGSAPLHSIFLTHAHIDHAGGVRALLERGHPQVLGHRDDRPLRSTIDQQAAFFGLSAEEYQNCPEPNRFVTDGDIVALGTVEGQVLFTPGHAPGHVVWFFPAVEATLETYVRSSRGEPVRESSEHFAGPLLIGGDTVFRGGIGRTDLPGGDHKLLLKNIREKILTLPPETRILSGHGPDTEVGYERTTNPFFDLRSGTRV